MPEVTFNFVTTLDGRATINGSSRALGGDADLETLLSLRAGADAVLVGSSTVRAEGYGRLVGPERRPTPPPLVIISRSFNIPWEAPLFEAADQPVLIYGPGEAPSGLAAPVEVVRLDDPSPRAVVEDLGARGVQRLLSEGGPTLFRAFLAEGLVDQLCLTLAPHITASEETGIVSGGALPEVAHFTLTSVRQAGDELLLRYATLR